MNPLEAEVPGWGPWLRGLGRWLIHRRGRTQALVTCLHPQWSTCKFHRRWCLTCGKTISC